MQRVLVLLLLSTAACSTTGDSPGPGAGGSGPGAGGAGSGGGTGEPVLLAEAEVPFSLAAQGESVVWTDVHWEDSVRTAVVNRAPKTGGTVDRVAEQGGDDVSFYGIAADEADVHWVGYGQSAPGALFGAPTSGTAPTVVAADQGAPIALARGGESLFWINLSPGGAIGLGAPSDAPVTLADDPQDSSSCIAVAGADVVWLSHAGTPRISRVATGGGPAAVVTEGPDGGSIMCLTADAEHVYFTRGGTSTGDFEPSYNGDGSVQRIPVGGGAAEVLASDQEHPHGIALRGGFVYWLNGDGGLRRVSEAGGEVETLVEPGSAANAPRTQTVVADADGVYWISERKVWALLDP